MTFARLTAILAFACLVSTGAAGATAGPEGAPGGLAVAARTPLSVDEARPPATAGPEPEEDAVPPESSAPKSKAETASEPVEILYDFDRLPEPVARMRRLIIDAAASGDIEALEPLVAVGPRGTRLDPGGQIEDPIAYLRGASGDGEGREILAIMLDLLDAGFVAMETKERGTVYLWPYFYALPIEELTPAQQVELFRIVTAGDLADMKAYGGYNFYRLGITAEGEWHHFLLGH